MSNIIGENIKAARLAKGWSQVELAESLGNASTQAQVSRWESGRHLPTEPLASLLAKALDIPLKSVLLAQPEALYTPRIAAHGTQLRHSDPVAAFDLRCEARDARQKASLIARGFTACKCDGCGEVRVLDWALEDCNNPIHSPEGGICPGLYQPIKENR